MAGALIFAYKNKKANTVVDTITFIVILFVLVIATFMGKYIFTSLNDDIQADPDFNNQTQTMMQEQHDRYSGFFDAIFLLVFLLMWGLVLVASFNIDSHPIFFVFSIILLIFVFMVAGYLSNAYDDFSTDPDIASVTATFPMTDWILSHFIIVAVVIGFSVLLVLFGKNRLG